jgi:hypothetical protein
MYQNDNVFDLKFITSFSDPLNVWYINSIIILMCYIFTVYVLYIYIRNIHIGGSEKLLKNFKLNILSFWYILFHFVLEHAIIILHHSNFYTNINSCFIRFSTKALPPDNDSWLLKHVGGYIIYTCICFACASSWYLIK